MLTGLSPVEREDPWQEIAAALKEFEQNGQCEGLWEWVIAVGTQSLMTSLNP